MGLRLRRDRDRIGVACATLLLALGGGSGGCASWIVAPSAPAPATATATAPLPPDAWDDLAAALAADAAAAGIPALALTLVDRDTILWSGGVAPAGTRVAELRFRAGSVSKVFTDLAVLQLVERGVLTLDEPVARWLPDALPADPRAAAITLRQLMAHRSGLVREPPRGSYFDATPPALAECVASLADTALIDPPGTRTKYSNAGISAVGRVVELAGGEPFAQAVERRVLQPMGLLESRFERREGDRERLAPGVLWADHLPPWPAPDFPFGIGPAGNLEAPIADLARAAQCFLRGGSEHGGVPIRAESLAELTTVQDGSGGARGFGFGLWIDEWEGTRRWNHDGAVYGASTLLVLLPDVGLGVVATAAKDCVQRLLWRRANDALRRARALREGRPPPALTAPTATDATVAAPPALPPRPAPPPAELTPLLGEYGPDHAILYVREADGALETQVEWHFTDRPRRLAADRFVFPDGSLYEREELCFVRGADGRVTGAFMAGIWFARRAIEPPDGAPFRITPTAPLAELELAARLAKPPAALLSAPRAADLVDLAALGAGLRFDIRYATADNFLGAPVYAQPRAFLQRPAAQALVRAQARLAAAGLGLIVHDAYRPWHVTRLFHAATPPQHHAMVADPLQGSRHNRGCAVDVSLCDAATGLLLAAPSGYDEFSPRANPRWPGGSAHERWVRETLRVALEAVGFTVHPHEWWHFDFVGWQEWPVLNLAFEELPAAG